jgi:hypothetical protein
MGLAGLAELVSRPVFVLSDKEIAAGLDAVAAGVAVLEGLRLRLVREADARGLAVAAGVSSTAVWLRNRALVSPQTAARWVKLAAGLDGTLTGEALSEGRVNLEQAAVIAHAVGLVPVEHRDAGEKALLGQAAVLGPRELARLGEHLVDLVDPAGAEAAEAARLEKAERKAYAGRELNLTDVGDGRTRLTGWLDREGAAVVRAALDPLCDPRTGSATDGFDTRTPTQRRADALVDLCRLGLATGQLPDNGGDRPQVAVTLDWKTLREQVGAARLDDGATISPAAARRLACDAGLLPVVLGGAGQPLDVGRQRRLFTGPLRRAVLIRDRGCAFPTCDRPARWTDIHHIRHWVDGGPTTLNNAVALCGHHHRVIHSGRWQVSINPRDGHPDFTGPGHPGPTRNKYHRRE